MLYPPPPEQHNTFKEFVPAPETLTPSMEWLSDYHRANDASLEVVKNGKYRGSHKLVPHLFEHKNYVIQYRSLKFLLN